METITLKHNILGFWRVVFQGVSATAPAAVVSTITAASIYAYGAVPLSFLIAFVGVLTTIVAIYQYSKKIAHAGGYYAYVGQSAGPFLGILTGFLLIGYQITDLAFLPLYFTVLFTFALQFFAGIVLPTYIWIVVVILVVLLWTVLPYLGIKPSLNYSVIFSVAEIAALVSVGVIIAVLSGPQNTAMVFTPTFSPTGIHGALLGGVFAITSFLGYGSIVTLGEEAKFPKKTISKALLTNVLISGTFFLIVTYCYTIGWGPHNMATMSSYLVPLAVEAKKIVGVGAALLITLFFIESFFNSGLSFTNSAVRYFYGFSRDDHIIPKYFSKVHEKSGVPRRSLAVIVSSVLVLAIVFGFGFGPFMGFVLLATIATIFSLVVHIIVNSTVGLLYKREKEFNVFLHLIIPLIASGLFAFIIYATVYPPSFPLTYMPIAAFIWAILAIVLILIVRRRKPQQYKEAGTHSTVE
ncbi:MAG: APC family permease [Thermoplasmatales archaeon]